MTRLSGTTTVDELRLSVIAIDVLPSHLLPGAVREDWQLPFLAQYEDYRSKWVAASRDPGPDDGTREDAPNGDQKLTAPWPPGRDGGPPP